jgi:NADPH:quinone reductase-like Zn-dependent oxidoreductase
MNSYGGSEVIEITQNTSVPNNPSVGKVLVNVKAAGINPIDWKIREGYMEQLIHLQFPSSLGMDFSGVNESVIDSVPGLTPQDGVYGQPVAIKGGSGAFAEMALANTLL